MAELISVIVTTYNREDALDAVLRSLAGQIDADFEVIVADDGSGFRHRRARRQLEGEIRSPSGARLARRPRIPRRRNSQPRDLGCARRILRFSGWRLHRASGLCRHSSPIGRARLVRDRQSRFALVADLTMTVLREKQTPESWSALRWLAERWRGGVNRLSALLHLPLGPLRRIRQRTPGKAHAHATSPSGGPILIVLTDSTPTTAAGARKIPILSCACCMRASVARMGHLRPA